MWKGRMRFQPAVSHRSALRRQLIDEPVLLPGLIIQPLLAQFLPDELGGWRSPQAPPEARGTLGPELGDRAGEVSGDKGTASALSRQGPSPNRSRAGASLGSLNSIRTFNVSWLLSTSPQKKIFFFFSCSTWL